MQQIFIARLINVRFSGHLLDLLMHLGKLCGIRHKAPIDKNMLGMLRFPIAKCNQSIFMECCKNSIICQIENGEFYVILRLKKDRVGGGGRGGA